MNNAKMWLVVSPTVGVPLFLGAVAVGSFSVHVAVLSNTGWVSDFLSGDELGGGGGEESAAATMLENGIEPTAASYAVPTAEGLEVTITQSDGTTVTGILTVPADPLQDTY